MKVLVLLEVKRQPWNKVLTLVHFFLASQDDSDAVRKWQHYREMTFDFTRLQIAASRNKILRVLYYILPSFLRPLLYNIYTHRCMRRFIPWMTSVTVITINITIILDIMPSQVRIQKKIVAKKYFFEGSLPIHLVKKRMKHHETTYASHRITTPNFLRTSTNILCFFLC